MFLGLIHKKNISMHNNTTHTVLNLSVRKNPDLITAEEIDCVPTSRDQCFLCMLICVDGSPQLLFILTHPPRLLLLLLYSSFSSSGSNFFHLSHLEHVLCSLPDGHSLTFSGSGYVKYHLMENENKELMRLSLKLRTFSTHATVMYARGTDYSILEVRLGRIYPPLTSPTPPKPTFSCWFVIFPYQSSIKTKTTTKKSPFLHLMRDSSSEHQPC